MPESFPLFDVPFGVPPDTNTAKAQLVNVGTLLATVRQRLREAGAECIEECTIDIAECRRCLMAAAAKPVELAQSKIQKVRRQLYQEMLNLLSSAGELVSGVSEATKNPVAPNVAGTSHVVSNVAGYGTSPAIISLAGGVPPAPPSVAPTSPELYEVWRGKPPGSVIYVCNIFSVNANPRPDAGRPWLYRIATNLTLQQATALQAKCPNVPPPSPPKGGRQAPGQSGGSQVEFMGKPIPPSRMPIAAQAAFGVQPVINLASQPTAQQDLAVTVSSLISQGVSPNLVASILGVPLNVVLEVINYAFPPAPGPLPPITNPPSPPEPVPPLPTPPYSCPPAPDCPPCDVQPPCDTAVDLYSVYEGQDGVCYCVLADSPPNEANDTLLISGITADACGQAIDLACGNGPDCKKVRQCDPPLLDMNSVQTWLAGIEGSNYRKDAKTWLGTSFAGLEKYSSSDDIGKDIVDSLKQAFTNDMGQGSQALDGGYWSGTT